MYNKKQFLLVDKIDIYFNARSIILIAPRPAGRTVAVNLSCQMLKTTESKWKQKAKRKPPTQAKYGKKSFDALMTGSPHHGFNRERVDIMASFKQEVLPYRLRCIQCREVRQPSQFAACTWIFPREDSGGRQREARSLFEVTLICI